MPKSSGKALKATASKCVIYHRPSCARGIYWVPWPQREIRFEFLDLFYAVQLYRSALLLPAPARNCARFSWARCCPREVARRELLRMGIGGAGRVAGEARILLHWDQGSVIVKTRAVRGPVQLTVSPDYPRLVFQPRGRASGPEFEAVGKDADLDEAIRITAHGPPRGRRSQFVKLSDFGVLLPTVSATAIQVAAQTGPETILTTQSRQQRKRVRLTPPGFSGRNLFAWTSAVPLSARYAESGDEGRRSLPG